MDKSKKPTTIAFDERADAELERLATELGTTRAGVIRHALGLYSFLARQLGDDAELVLRDRGKETRIAVPGLELPTLNRAQKGTSSTDSAVPRSPQAHRI